jgi:hypothetical protein
VHPLLEVTLEAFKSCDESAPLQAFLSGDLDITLTKPGTFYYIKGRCFAKHIVTVLGVDTEQSQPEDDDSAHLEQELLQAAQRRLF